MRRSPSTLGLAVIVLAVGYVLVPQTAFAYLDPGSGSYIFQMALAVFVSAFFAVKMYWKKLTSFVSQLLSGDHSKSEDPEA